MEAKNIVVCFVIAAFLPQCILGCSPMEGGEPSQEENIAAAEIILLGEVVKQYSNTHLIGRAYTAEMNLFCVLRAPAHIPISALQNITEAGFIEGMCYSVTLDVGKRYIVLGHTSGGTTIKPYDNAIEASMENIQMVSQQCNMNPRLPIGVKPDEATRCPLHVDDKGCINMAPASDDSHDHDDHDHDHDDHDHDDHHDDHDHDDHHDDHHSDDHAHNHDEHMHDDNEHDHDNDGEHTHADHHDGHGHDYEDHDHDSHHEDHGHHDHDHDHDEHETDHSHDDHDHEHDHDHEGHDHEDDHDHGHDDHHDGDDDMSDHDHEDHHGDHDHQHGHEPAEHVAYSKAGALAVYIGVLAAALLVVIV